MTFRMCDSKVRFASEAAAMAELSVQQSQRPHWLWTLYDCLWCDYLHIGRHRIADGHSPECEPACSRRTAHDRELRILEGTW